MVARGRPLPPPLTPKKRDIMKFLLTSAGISNDSIRNALVDLLGKPIAESSALCIPTAAYACPGGASMAYRFISGSATSPLCEMGWKSLGVLELTALPSIKARTVGPHGPGDRRSAGCTAAISCICAIGCGSPDWQTSCRRFARDGLCGGERREHGGDSQLGRGLRQLFLSGPPASNLPGRTIER